jgi:hypothetical protein
MDGPFVLVVGHRKMNRVPLCYRRQCKLIRKWIVKKIDEQRFVIRYKLSAITPPIRGNKGYSEKLLRIFWEFVVLLQHLLREEFSHLLDKVILSPRISWFGSDSLPQCANFRTFPHTLILVWVLAGPVDFIFNHNGQRSLSIWLWAPSPKGLIVLLLIAPRCVVLLGRNSFFSFYQSSIRRPS